jgi:tetratricopeptide (TPR) repeat protein
MEWVHDFGPRKVRVAAELARRRVADAPDVPERWLALANILTESGERDAAVASLRDAVVRLPGSAKLRCRLASALIRHEAFEEARAQADAALALAPGDPEIRKLHFELLARTRSWDAAGKSLDAMAGSVATSRAIMTQERRLDSASLLTFCEAQLAEGPASTAAIFYKAIALARLGRGEEACAVMALDKHVAICDLPPPAGYGDGETFRQLLAEEICRNPTLASDPRGKATRDGRQTRHLRQPDAVAIEALIAQIKRAGLRRPIERIGRSIRCRTAGIGAPGHLGRDLRQGWPAKSPSASSRLAERRLLRHGASTRRRQSLSRAVDLGRARPARARRRTALGYPRNRAGAGQARAVPLLCAARHAAERGRRRTHQRRFRRRACKTFDSVMGYAAPRSAVSGKSCVS